MAYELTYTLIDNDTHYKVSGYTGTPIDVVIPMVYNDKPVTEIGGVVNTAFMGCQTIKSVVIPDSIIKVGDYAFCACPLLETVKMSNSLREIGFNAFSNCRKLAAVVIPAYVKSIGDYAFTNDTALKDITLLGTTPPTFSAHTFANISSIATYYCYNSALAVFRIAFKGYKVISDDIRIASLQLAIATKLQFIAKNNPVLSLNDLPDNIQAIVVSTACEIVKGNLSAIIGSDGCEIGDSTTEKNGRQVIIGSKTCKTNANDTSIIASRECEIYEGKTESSIIGAYRSHINEKRCGIVGGREGLIDHTNGTGGDSEDAQYGFIGGGQNNTVRHRNAATVGGFHLTTTARDQLLAGRYNDLTHANVLFAVGDGTNGSGHNALETLDDGSTRVNKAPINANDVVRLSDISGLQRKLTQSTDLTPTTQTLTLSANTRYALGSLTALSLTFPSNANDGDEIIIAFVSGSTATTLTLDNVNAIYNFSSVNTDKFVELNAQFKVSIGKWVVYSAETDYTVV